MVKVIRNVVIVGGSEGITFEKRTRQKLNIEIGDKVEVEVKKVE